MEDEDLAFAGIARQAELIRDGEVSSRELVELYLERIERLGPQLNAFAAVMDQRALADADAADERRAAGGEGAPLLGVPVAVKDNVDVEGVPTRFGSLGYPETPAVADDVIVRRLRDAGAVIVAKTTLSELAICRSPRLQGGAARAIPGTRTVGRWLERWQRGSRSGGPRRRRLGDRRRWIDPDSGGVLRPVRAQASARPRADGAPRPLEQPLGKRLRNPHGRRHGGVPGRRHGGRRRPRWPTGSRAAVRRGGAMRAGTTADRDLRASGAGRAAAGPRRRGQGRARRDGGAAAVARPRRPPPRAVSYGLAGQNFVPRYLAGIAEDVALVP